MDPRAAVMRCSNPRLIAAYVTKRGVHVDAARRPCGKCPYCCWRSGKDSWAVADREYEATCIAELGTVMGSLTIDEKSMVGALATMGRMQWRAFTMAMNKLCPGLKWFAVPEFGDKHGRLHLHFMVYGVPMELCRLWFVRENGHNVGMFGFRELVRQAWLHGFERCDVARGQGAGRYVMKYLGKGRFDNAVRHEAWKRDVLEPAKLAQWQRQRDLVRWGLPKLDPDELLAELPVYAKLFWTAWPRGRQGGLGSRYAQQLAQDFLANSQAFAEARARGDLPRHLIGARNRPVAISRSERRVCRRELGLDDERSKALRAAANPERVEIAYRIQAAGSVDALRRVKGHVDPDVAMVFEAKALTAKNLGRW